jgi:hypothetical protein
MLEKDLVVFKKNKDLHDGKGGRDRDKEMTSKGIIKAIYNDNGFISTQELEELIDSLCAASEGTTLLHSDAEQVAVRESLLYRCFQ